MATADAVNGLASRRTLAWKRCRGWCDIVSGGSIGRHTPGRWFVCSNQSLELSFYSCHSTVGDCRSHDSEMAEMASSSNLSPLTWRLRLRQVRNVVTKQEEEENQRYSDRRVGYHAFIILMEDFARRSTMIVFTICQFLHGVPKALIGFDKIAGFLDPRWTRIFRRSDDRAARIIASSEFNN